MDIGSVRPATPGVTAPVPRAPAESGFQVRTDLPARSVVGGATKPEQGTLRSGTDAGRRQAEALEAQAKKQANRDLPQDRAVDQEIELDAETNALVFKKIDVQSGEVVRQVPEESMLRMRALIQTWDEGGGDKATAVDVTA